MKKFILGIVAGLLLGSVSVYAVTNYFYSSDEVNYTPSDTSWNVSTVKAALDNLKSTSGSALTNLKNTDIAKAVSANGSSLSSVIDKLDSIATRGNISKSINPGSSTSISSGYYSGGSVSCSSCPAASQNIINNIYYGTGKGKITLPHTMSSYIVLLNANNKHYGSGRDAYESGGAYVSAKTSTSFTIDSQNNNGFSYQIIEFNPDFIGVIYGTNTTGSSTVTHNIGNLNYFVILNANADNVSAGEDSYASSGAYISDKSINSFTVTSYRCKHGLSYQIVYLK